MSKYYSWHRLWAVILKEFIQMLRDRGTLAIMIGIPLIQVVMFGFAINVNPKELPTAVVLGDYSPFTRAFMTSLENSDYFRIIRVAKNEQEARRLLATNKALFVVNFPPNFSRDFVRGDHPSILLEADATDPAATGNAIGAVVSLTNTAFSYLLKGSLHHLKNTTPQQSYDVISTNPQFASSRSPIDLRVHSLYNPEARTQLNIVPGLMGVVLTLTLVMITAVAMTRERERGTMENLLATPARPLEVMAGKVIPYIIVGYVQALLILIAAAVIFNVPVVGSVILLLIVTMPFIAANLIVGLTLSTIAKNQLQAVQMSTFFFLPSILISGYMFPFLGMPYWAQWIGEILPLTHFLRIVRGILLKGNGWFEVWPDVWPILVFLTIIMIIGVLRYKRTLD